MTCFIHSELTARDPVAAFGGRKHYQKKRKKGNDNRKLLKLVSSLGSSRTVGMTGKDCPDNINLTGLLVPSSSCNLHLYIYSVILQ